MRPLTDGNFTASSKFRCFDPPNSAGRVRHEWFPKKARGMFLKNFCRSVWFHILLSTFHDDRSGLHGSAWAVHINTFSFYGNRQIFRKLPPISSKHIHPLCVLFSYWHVRCVKMVETCGSTDLRPGCHLSEAVSGPPLHKRSRRTKCSVEHIDTWHETRQDEY